MNKYNGEERPVAGGTTYYVSPEGNNQNPGTKESPWATPAYGAKRLKPGDTLIIQGGRYVLSSFGDDMVTPPASEPGAWITIKGEEGARPSLIGVNNLYAAIEISNAQYLRLENLEITSNGQQPFRSGISSWEPAAHVVLDNIYIHHLDEIGVNFRDIDDLKLLNSRIEYCGFGAVGGPKGEHGGWRNVLITNCRFSYSGHYYQGTPGPLPYDRPDGFGIEPSPGPVEIGDTTVEHNRGDGLDSKAANTYIHHCKYSGDAPISLAMRNCILSHGPGRVYIGPDVSFTSDHNLFYWPGHEAPIEVAGRQYTNTEVEEGAIGAGILARDPLFVKWEICGQC
ncbi:MAG: right-handed parallel beta-helix repeat-containing protein [Bacillota bacterium]